MMHQSGPPQPGFAQPPPYYPGNQPPPPPHYGQPQSMYVNPPPPMPMGGYDQGPITQQPTVVMNVAQYGPDPQRMVCPYCHANIVTRVEQSATNTTHMAALFLCCCTDCWACAPCLYCCDCCASKQHFCPNCNHYLGKYD